MPSTSDATWRRRSGAWEAVGAADLPGSTWRDRPAVDHADGVWLAGDWVGAPGHLAEVSATSAVQAARAAVAAVGSAGAGSGVVRPRAAGSRLRLDVSPAG